MSISTRHNQFLLSTIGYDIALLKNLKREVSINFETANIELKHRFEKIKQDQDIDIEQLEDHYYSEISIKDSMLLLLAEYLIIGLYKITEQTARRILQPYYGEKKVNDMFKNFDELPKTLKKDGINLINLDNFTEINELRMLNNAIKHQGEVTDELINNFSGYNKNQSWEIEGSINNISSKFDTINDKPSKFLENLAEEVEKLMNNNSS